MIDTLERWRELGEKPDYAGLLTVLRVVGFADAAVVPADPVRSHAAIEATVGRAVAAGALPIVLGGDHSIAEANVGSADVTALVAERLVREILTGLALRRGRR